ncbi:MFS transporter [Dyadobacter sp. CY312]|uniref:MFS transporter n=1 Tax=Dyadobacter sp. CY312 TaxID=2907303 RepID=UPI001F1EC5D7|nr:MFS transporter [Dyadobacter sp. CY312]MCE7040930.1 MFS transporter [Dyadobacter sp. CY312]
MASTSPPASTLSDKKPNLSFWDIWNMSFGFLGIQFGFALQNANVSRIFETLGANVDDIPILWVAAPLTGLIIQPIIGYFSDRTWTRLGRRRPYFLAGAIVASLSLLIMPNSPSLWFAAGMLWMLDASINVTMEPFRAFVGDNLPSRQRTSGFAMQSFFIGIGAIVASSLPYIFTNWFDISNQAAPGLVPDAVKWSFYLGGFVFLIAVIWTVAKSKEYSPEQLKAFSNAHDDSGIEVHNVSETDRQKMIRQGVILSVVGLVLSGWFVAQDLNKELYIFSVGVLIAGVLFIGAGIAAKSGTSPYVTIMSDLQNMPVTMKQLAVVQFFSWFALFSMWIYMTSAVTSHLYGTSDTTSKLYNDGADWVGLCMGVYNGISALVAFLIPVVARKTNRRFTHMICLIAGGIALLSVYILPDAKYLMLSMVGVGIAWASILSVPYAMLAGSLPAEKMGYFMGLFNFFIVIPQIVAAALLGFLIKSFFAGESIYALLIGGVAMIIAGLLSLRVHDVDDE